MMTISTPLWLSLLPTTSPSTTVLLIIYTTFIPLCLLLLTMHLMTLIATDYKAFLALGPGGTPATPQGYIRIKFLSLFALKDPYSPTLLPVAPSLRGVLKHIPQREGPRPIVAGIAPHRQRNQRASEEAFVALRSAIENIASQQKRLLVRTSCLEKHGPGLFIVPGGAWGEQTLLQRCGGEVCHAHPSDGSLHLTLHPADEATVLRAGWGELHPLAKGGWLSRFVPARFMMVYAPRTSEELETVIRIVKAAAWWVGGLDIDGDNEEIGWQREIEGIEEQMGTAVCEAVVCAETRQNPVMIMS